MKPNSTFKSLFGFALSVLLVSQISFAQTNTFPSTGAAGIGTITPNASSLLDITSTTKGVLVPRMTQTQRNAIVTPATGLLIYQTNNTTGFYYYSGTAWAAVTPKSKGWSLTGNVGTVPGTNFIGTNDAMDLVIKTNNTERLRVLSTGNVGIGTLSPAGMLHVKGNTDVSQLIIDANSTQSSTHPLIKLRNSSGTDLMWIHSDDLTNSFVGSNAGRVNNAASGGIYNTFTGSKAGYSNTTGSGNSANGYQALFSNTTGNYNTANGVQALLSNTTGNSNTANGLSTLFSNKAGNNGVAIGYSSQQNVNNTATSWDNTNTSLGFQSLRGSGNPANNTGEANTAIGREALLSNSSGSFNTATGLQALTTNTTGSWNTANGQAALYNNKTGNANTALGLGALFTDTEGYNNTATGYGALYFNITGGANTANGYEALYNNTIWGGNTANGFRALYNNTTGSGNTANGTEALFGNTTGNNNTALGNNADISSVDLTNATAIGYNAIVDVNNKVRIGNTSVTSIGGQVGWTTFPSDGRYKKNIREDVKGLAFINSLHPITYTVDINALNEYFDKGRKHDRTYEKMKKDMQPSEDEASKIVYNGFIAQDVEAAAKKLNYNFSGVDKPKTNDGLYGLRYADFVVPLVKAVQELSAANDAKDAALAAQQKINADLQKQIDELKSLITSGGISSQSTVNTQLSTASIEQNIPNPFNQTTTINYTLPNTFSSAKIIVVDKSGKVLKEINVSGKGKRNITVDAATLASGAYNYSLYVDGKLIATKQMILAK